MAVVKLRCESQKLFWETPPEEIYSGNVKIDKAQFSFSSEWDGFAKTVVFSRGDMDKPVLVLLGGDGSDSCDIPPEATRASGLVYIGVFGIKGEARITSSVKSLYLGEGTMCEGVPSEPTEDVYRQIVNLCSDAANTAESVRRDADAGLFDGAPGEKGEKGDPGTDGEDGYTPQRGIDYWTEADRAEIKSYVDDAILGGAW